MKVFHKTHLPDAVIYNKNTYLLNTKKTVSLMLFKMAPKGKYVIVEVLSKNLKGKTDLHGRLYSPTRHVFEKLV